MKKTIKISLLIFGSIILLFIASLFTFGKFYGDTISQIVISELNKRLNVKVAVGSVEFSMFKHFPSASISLNDVTIYSSETFKRTEFKEKSDILLKSKLLSLQFNILDLIKRKYNINKISAINADLHIFIDKKGNNNFQILKADTSTALSKVTIDLKKVQADNCKYSYIDTKNLMVCNGFIENGTLKGRFTSNDFTLETNIKGISKQISVNKQPYPSNIAIELESSLHVLNNNYKINHCNLSLNDIETRVSGIIQKQKFYFVNVKTEINFAKLSELQIYLPIELQKRLKPWDPEGEIELTVLTKGTISNTILPAITIKFSLENGSFIHNKQLNKIECQGQFLSKNINDINNYNLTLDTLILKHNNSSYSGQLSLTDFSKAHIKSSGQLHLDIEDIYHFTENEKTILKGIVVGSIAVETDAAELNAFDEHIFEKLHLTSKLEISNGYFLYKPNIFSEVSNVSASIKTDNDNYVIDTCSLQYFDTKMTIKGNISNVLKFVMTDNQVLQGELSAKSNCIDYNKILKTSLSDSSSLILPLLYNVKVHFETECLDYEKINFQNIRGSLTYNADGIKAENLSFFVFGGRFNGDLYISQLKDNGFELKSKCTTTNIYVDKIFTAFNNFDQKTLIDKNIKGLITSQIMFSTELNNDFSLKPKTLLMEYSATIMNGRLLNFEPMKKLSKFVDVAELEDVSFSTLKNNFVIRDEKITIPQMEIKSSALSLQMSGIHMFSNNFEYNVQLYLSELLAKKHRNKHPDEYFGEVVDDGAGQTRLPIKIIGTPSGITMTYDTKTAKENVKETIKKEKSEIARMFKEEFGFAKKDTVSSIKTPVKKEEIKQKFEIEFE